MGSKLTSVMSRSEDNPRIELNEKQLHQAVTQASYAIQSEAMPSMDASEDDSEEELDWFEAQHLSAREMEKRYPMMHEITVQGGLKEAKT